MRHDRFEQPWRDNWSVVGAELAFGSHAKSLHQVARQDYRFDLCHYLALEVFHMRVPKPLVDQFGTSCRLD